MRREGLVQHGLLRLMESLRTADGVELIRILARGIKFPIHYKVTCSDKIEFADTHPE